jgi:small subunit ribosomal protein S5
MSKNLRKKRGNRRRPKPEFEQKLLDLARVTRVVKGGRRFRFRATVVIGNRKGTVGVGVAKGADVSQAIQKAFADAKKNAITIQLHGNTILHDIRYKQGSAKVLLRPAVEGRGIIAGGAVRTVIDLVGIKDVVSKSMGTKNKLNVARATVSALGQIKVIEKEKFTNNKKGEDKENDKKVEKKNSKKIAKKQ